MKRFLTRKNIAATVIAASMAGAILPGMMPRVQASRDLQALVDIPCATQDELDQKKNERDQALSKAEAASARAEELRSQQDDLSGELTKLNKLTDEQRDQYELAASQYSAAQLEKAIAIDEYVTAQENLIETKEVFSERLSVMFEYQNKSTLEILLESDSIAGFFTNIELISLIADADDQAVDQMQIALDDAKLKTDNALNKAEEMEALAEEKLAVLEEYEKEVGIKEESLRDITAQIEAAEAEAGDYEARAQRLNGEISSIQEELYTRITPTPAPRGESESSTEKPSEVPTDPTPAPTDEPTVEPGQEPTATPVPTPIPTTPPEHHSSGQLSWPSWSRTIRDYYGYRIHPISGVQKFHGGLDIGADYGDAILAAAGGTVSLVEEPVEGQNMGGSGYGNYVIIDHGNGLYTLYGHARDIYVSSGESVSAGQQIGEVGSTGGSTGPHLHFEVRLGGPWGNTDDPLNYLA